MKILPTLVVLTSITIAAPAMAATYDVAQDFNFTNNPNGVWTYGFEPVLGGPLVLYDQKTTIGGLEFWQSSTVQTSLDPTNFYNPTSSSITLSTLTLGAMTAAFHPGEQDQYSVYRFTAPTAGTYSLTSSFARLDSGGTDVHILVGGLDVFNTQINSGNPTAGYSHSYVLTANETIDFAVGFGADGNYFNDSTSISAQITGAIPEPSTWAMMLLGFCGLGFMAYRRSPKIGLNAA